MKNETQSRTENLVPSMIHGMLEKHMKKRRERYSIWMVNMLYIKIFRNLLLQGKNMGNTSINGVSDPCLSFIGDSDNRLTAFSNRDMQQQLRYITSTKNLMNGCKSSRPLFRAKVRRKNTIGRTFSPEKLACSTRGASACPWWCHDGRNKERRESSWSFFFFFKKKKKGTRAH